MLKSKKKMCFIKGYNLSLGSASKPNFWQYFNGLWKEIYIINFEIENI